MTGAAKQLKMLGLVAVAAAALMAIAGIGTASAAVLCTETKVKTCPANEHYVVGTPIQMSLESEVSLVFRDTSGKTTFNSCTSLLADAKLTSTGGILGVPVEGAWQELNFEESCTSPVAVLKKGGFDIEYIPGTNTRGTFTLKETSLSSTFSGLSCTYGAAAVVDAGELTGKTATSLATSDFSAVLKKEGGSFLCLTNIVAEAKFIFTEPELLYFKEEVK